MDAFSIDVKDISYLLPHDRLLIAVEECTGVSVCILPVYEIVKEIKSVEYRTSFHVSWNGPVLSCTFYCLMTAIFLFLDAGYRKHILCCQVALICPASVEMLVYSCAV